MLNNTMKNYFLITLSLSAALFIISCKDSKNKKQDNTNLIEQEDQDESTEKSEDLDFNEEALEEASIVHTNQEDADPVFTNEADPENTDPVIIKKATNQEDADSVAIKEVENQKDSDSMKQPVYHLYPKKIVTKKTNQKDSDPMLTKKTNQTVQQNTKSSTKPKSTWSKTVITKKPQQKLVRKKIHPDTAPVILPTDLTSSASRKGKGVLANSRYVCEDTRGTWYRLTDWVYADRVMYILREKDTTLDEKNVCELNSVKDSYFLSYAETNIPEASSTSDVNYCRRIFKSLLSSDNNCRLIDTTSFIEY